MRLESVTIQNIHGFKDEVCIPFSKSKNVIIGENGSGKTTLLKILEKILISFLSSDGGSKSDPKLKFNIESLIQFKFDKIDNYFKISNFHENSFFLQLSNDDAQIRNKILNIKDNSPVFIFINANLNESDRVGVSSKIPTYKENITNLSISGFNINEFFAWYDRQDRILKHEAFVRKDNNYIHKPLQKFNETMNQILQQLYSLNQVSLEVKQDDKENKLVLYLKKNDNFIEFRSLSSGEQRMFSIIYILISQISEINPKSDSFSEAEGIVMIDEIDSHFHPRWQAIILDSLTSAFPNIQFIVTSHSPYMINNLKQDEVIYLDNFKYTPSDKLVNIYGRDINFIVKYLMGVEIRPKIIVDQVKKIEALIDSDKLSDASKELEILKSSLDENDFEVIRLDTLIQMENAVH
ncbi:MAG TPA: AAA family ATPase [Saprospiraceae bacterium]|nr:AAA family ATPase [Saprospiraceae bacterium]